MVLVTSHQALLIAALAAVVVAADVAKAAQPMALSPQGAGSSVIDISVQKSTEQAKLAWALTKQLEGQAQNNLRYPPLVKAQIALAMTAADTAAEEDQKMQALVDESREATNRAALEAAQAFYARVKAAGATAAAAAKAAREGIDDGVETRAATAAVKAAMPYHAMLLRGQKVVTDYANNAQALAAASNNLKVEGASLAYSAGQYQAAGEAIKAAQVMMTAHQLFKQGQAYGQEAKQLQASAQEVMAALPLYHQAEQAAANMAAAGPVVLPDNGPRPY